MSEQEIFADKIIEVGLVNDMIRMDLVSVAINDEPQGDTPPRMAFRQRIVMPPDGFLKSFELMQNLVRKLEDRGMIERQASPATPSK